MSPPRERARAVATAVARGLAIVLRPLRAGLTATAGRIWPRLRPPLERLARTVTATAVAIARASAAGFRAAVRATLAVWHGCGRAVDRAAEAVRPEQVLALVSILAAAMLALSQFFDYRAVDIVTVELDRKRAGEAHLFVLLPVAIAAMAASYLALVQGRWQMGRAVTALALVAVAVSLLVDIPRGLDEGSFAEDYAGASATLIEGFYAQLFSAITLAVTGWLLAARARAAAPDRRRSGQPAPGGAGAPFAEGSA